MAETGTTLRPVWGWDPRSCTRVTKSDHEWQSALIKTGPGGAPQMNPLSHIPALTVPKGVVAR